RHHREVRSELAVRRPPRNQRHGAVGRRSLPGISERFTANTGLSGDFEVELGRSGGRIRVPAGVSVLDALEERGIDVPWSCRAGICGTCETPLISGRTDHGDSLVGLTRAADVCFPCVVRAVDDVIVLDI
ncbi:2Fe-2S iron-sulfur cluster-binding protein, partial [Streptomyces asiaticus]